MMMMILGGVVDAAYPDVAARRTATAKRTIALMLILRRFLLMWGPSLLAASRAARPQYRPRASSGPTISRRFISSFYPSPPAARALASPLSKYPPRHDSAALRQACCVRLSHTSPSAWSDARQPPGVRVADSAVRRCRPPNHIAERAAVCSRHAA